MASNLEHMATGQGPHPLLWQSGTIHSFVPVQFIMCRCVSLVDRLDGESVLFVCPCVDY